MTFVESCIYYRDSKCMLKGGCCDLNCGMTESEKGNQSYDEIDAFTQWQIEKTKGGEGTSNLQSS
jgi:hypothetical protein